MTKFYAFIESGMFGPFQSEKDRENAIRGTESKFILMIDLFENGTYSIKEHDTLTFRLRGLNVSTNEIKRMGEPTMAQRLYQSAIARKAELAKKREEQKQEELRRDWVKLLCNIHVHSEDAGGTSIAVSQFDYPIAFKSIDKTLEFLNAKGFKTHVYGPCDCRCISIFWDQP